MINYIHLDNKKSDTIVFVHGFTQNCKIFNNQIEFFKNSFNLILVDLRGHGKSSDLSGPYGIEEYTDDLQEVFWNLSLRNIIYWGTHTGTAIGLNLYLRNPKCFSCMILEGAVIPGYETPDINNNLSKAKHVCSSHGLDKAIETWMTSQWFDYMRDNPIRARYNEHEKIIKSFKGSPWKSNLKPEKVKQVMPELGRFELPILAYNGENDMAEFFKMTNELKKCKDVSIELVPMSGGFPLWENPEYVNQMVERFLQPYLKE